MRDGVSRLQHIRTASVQLGSNVVMKPARSYTRGPFRVI